MPDNSPLVTIIGGSGFVGRHIAQRLARRGWRVRVACRRPNEAMYVNEVVPLRWTVWQRS